MKTANQIINTQNTVTAVGFYGSDETHARSAWCSTKATEKLTPELVARMPALLNMLATEVPKHTAPFEKSALHFYVRSDKASHVHIIKHRIGVSVNAESARYKEIKEDDLLYPDDLPDPGATLLGSAHDGDERHLAERILIKWRQAQEVAEGQYHSLLRDIESYKILTGVDPKTARKRAKETARLILPHASQLTSDVQFNFLSFMHFCMLRTPATAQREIRLIACEMLIQTYNYRKFYYSLKAFGWTLEKISALRTELLNGSKRIEPILSTIPAHTEEY